MRMAFPHLDLLKMVGKGKTYSRNDVKNFLVIGNVRGLTKSRLICEQVFGQPEVQHPSFQAVLRIGEEKSRGLAAPYELRDTTV